MAEDTGDFNFPMPSEPEPAPSAPSSSSSSDGDTGDFNYPMPSPEPSPSPSSGGDTGDYNFPLPEPSPSPAPTPPSLGDTGDYNFPMPEPSPIPPTQDTGDFNFPSLPINAPSPLPSPSTDPWGFTEQDYLQQSLNTGYQSPFAKYEGISVPELGGGFIPGITASQLLPKMPSLLGAGALSESDLFNRGLDKATFASTKYKITPKSGSRLTMSAYVPPKKSWFENVADFVSQPFHKGANIVGGYYLGANPESKFTQFGKGAPIAGPAIFTAGHWEELTPLQRGIGIGESVVQAASFGVPIFQGIRAARPLMEGTLPKVTGLRPLTVGEAKAVSFSPEAPATEQFFRTSAQVFPKETYQALTPYRPTMPVSEGPATIEAIWGKGIKIPTQPEGGLLVGGKGFGLPKLPSGGGFGGSGAATLPTTATMTSEMVATQQKALSSDLLPITIFAPKTLPTSRPDFQPTPIVTPLPVPRPLPVVIPNPVSPITIPVPSPFPVTTPLPDAGLSPIPGPAPSPFVPPGPFPTPTPVPLPIEPPPIPPDVPPVFAPPIPPPVVPPPSPFFNPTPKVPNTPPIKWPGFPNFDLGGGGSPSKRGSPFLNRGFWQFKGMPVFGPHPLEKRIAGGQFGKRAVKYGAVTPKMTSRVVGGAPANLGKQFVNSYADEDIGD